MHIVKPEYLLNLTDFILLSAIWEILNKNVVVESIQIK